MMRIHNWDELKKVEDEEFNGMLEEARKLSNGDELLCNKFLTQWVYDNLRKRLSQPRAIIIPRKPRSSGRTRRQVETPNPSSVPRTSTAAATSSMRLGRRPRDSLITEEKQSNKRKKTMPRSLDLEDLRRRGVRLDQPPEDVKAKVRELGGTDPVLVITKKFYETDANPHNTRFNLPLRQLDRSFLTVEEWETVMESESGMQVKLFGPQLLVTTELTLKKWNYQSGAIPVLTSNKWGKLLVEYKNRYPGVLSVGDVVQIWAFRCDGRKDLWLALVAVEKGAAHDGGA